MSQSRLHFKIRRVKGVHYIPKKESHQENIMVVYIYMHQTFVYPLALTLGTKISHTTIVEDFNIPFTNDRWFRQKPVNKLQCQVRSEIEWTEQTSTEYSIQ